MKATFLLLGFLAVTCSANSPTPFLDALISGAEKLRSGIKDVGSLIGKVTSNNLGGLQLGQIGMRHEEREHLNQPPPYMNEDSEDNSKTIIVIVEKPDSGYYGPGVNQYPQYQGPPQHYGPPHHHHHGPPHHHDAMPYFPAKPGYDQHNPYGNQPLNQNNNNRPNYDQNNQHNHADRDMPENSDKNNEHQGTPTTKPENKPDFGDKQDYKKHNDDDHATHDDKIKNPTDQPFRVPLNPNEYVYGGDKIEINAPKRETKTEEKKNIDEDVEFPIDVRVGNK